MNDALHFGSFRMDLGAERLWRRDQPVHLRPKTWAVLRFLVERPGRLVTKDELLAAVWESTAVTESTLTKSIGELRVALDDAADAPRFIETVHGRGFRFVGHATAAETPPVAPAATFVGRDAELAALAKHLDCARDGRRQVVFVTGEAGIGKTTLLDSFAAAQPRGVRIARGQCLHHFGAVEPYKPVLDALGGLVAGPDRAPVVDALERFAPTWLAQLPGMSAGAPGESTAARMIRELVTMLEAVTADVPLVLALEDVHWSDASTIDLVAELAQRREPASLLLVATYRPVDAIVHRHPIAELRQQLVVRRQCHELPLGLLSDDAVGAYLRARLSGEPATDATATLQRVTAGNPLFLTMMVDHLLARGALARTGERWQLVAAEDAQTSVPDSLREMIEHALGQLDETELALLEAASIAGAEFPAQLVAAAIETEVEHAEAVCATLARHGQFLRATGSTTWPDGSEAARFAFVHALHHQVLYDRVTAARRQRLHRVVGERLEAGWVGRTSEVAAELALHFERGKDFERTAAYARDVAGRAVVRGAHREAAAALRRALAALATAADSDDRVRQMSVLAMSLGASLQATHGYAHPSVGEAFEQARRGAEQVQHVTVYFMSVVGLTSWHISRSDLAIAREFAERLVAIADGAPMPGFVGLALQVATPALGMAARTLRGITHAMAGELAAARADMEAADMAGAGTWTFRPNFQAICRGYLAFCLGLRGEVDRARDMDARCIGAVLAADEPYDRTRALMTSGHLHAILRDRPSVLRVAEEGMLQAGEHGIALQRDALALLVAWAAPAPDIETMLAHLDAAQRRGTRMHVAGHLALVAEALTAVGRFADARARIGEGLALVERTGERWYEPELHRVHGEIVLAEGGARDEAAARFRRAIDLARAQEAGLWELRATTSLHRLRRRGEPSALAEVCGRFPAACRFADLDEARALLAAGRALVRDKPRG